MPTLQQARDLLARHFGFPDFRPGQVTVVESVLSRRDTLGVLPTGGGKSLCYQVPALALGGLTVVISPLISLMKDQVDRLCGRGIAAAYLNSTQDAATTASIHARIRSRELALLYVAPERFEAQDLARGLCGTPVSLLAVDEAHCISEWGHDFRPSFRRIADVCERLGRPPVVALTATATPQVRRDIEQQLRLRDARVIVCGFDRGNLAYEVQGCRRDAARDAALLASIRHRGRPSIVYAPTRAAVNRVARFLARHRIRAAGYHGGLGDAVRHAVQERFMRGRIDTIVATNAFGMGIDKPDVRLVVHYAMPGTLEAYYQEAGRAGRDGLPGHCILIHSDGDRLTHEWFIRGTFPSRAAVARLYAGLRDGDHAVMDIPALTRRCPEIEPRDVEAGVRLLEKHGVVEKPDAHVGALWVRLLATPQRIRRELAEHEAEDDLAVLRRAWRLARERLYDGVAFDPGTFDRTQTGALERLKARQFVDVGVTSGFRLVKPRAPFSSLAIDWDALARRRRAELAKLDRMEGYALTRDCRRRFVLAYFGERSGRRNCGGCDNCLGR